MTTTTLRKQTEKLIYFYSFSLLYYFSMLILQYRNVYHFYNIKVLSVRYEDMNKKIKTEAVDRLFDAILSLENKDECYSFFEDLCTVNELLSLSQRFEVAAMLKNRKTYLEIAEKTGASTATISRVNRSLNYGNDGYELVFGRIEK